MRNLILATLAATTILAVPAAAQDAGPFTGPRAGVIFGYDALRPGDTQDSLIRGDQGSDGFLYGGDLGYDVAFNGLVVGVEGEITGSTGRVTNDPRDPNDFGFGRVKAGRDLYIGGRIGFIATPTTLIYGKVGYTNARLDLTRDDTRTETGRNFNLDGFRVGAGVEQSLTPRTYAKLEYRYSNYGDARLNYPNGASTGTFGVDTDRHQVAAGVGFRF
ncbi:porin family protein [Sphingomonas sp. NBWT7]|uniref:outer membrane protein n=1 Tax=Sphingomonas sp. NBWT7 TaxID=2596913 RepID=UPI0016259712|nr:porin family protein [Sphingomonas sp. NBWT7]QNE31971.1 porin family protein [Sphingomonas sp. NBWT7]